jgi:hypothetical protein
MWRRESAGGRAGDVWSRTTAYYAAGAVVVSGAGGRRGIRALRDVPDGTSDSSEGAEIVLAIRAGDPRGAAHAMRRHVVNGQPHAMDYFDWLEEWSGMAPPTGVPIAVAPGDTSTAGPTNRIENGFPVAVARALFEQGIGPGPILLRTAESQP